MRATLLFALLLVSGCASVPDDEQSGWARARLDEEFTLALGDSISLDGTLYSIVFERVVEDSRCAQGMTCIWEGNARIELRLMEFVQWPPTGAPDTVGVTGFVLQLNTSPRIPTEKYDTGFVIDLRRLEPLPRAGEQTQGYTATLFARTK